MRFSWSVMITKQEDFDQPIVHLVAKIFTMIGIATLILALYFALSLPERHKDWIETKAVITGFSKDGYPDVAYSVDDRTYTAHMNSKNVTQRTGDTVTVRYNPNNPGDTATSPDWLLPVIFGGVSAVFGGLGIFVLHMARKARDMAFSGDQDDSAEQDDSTNDDTKYPN